MHKLFLCLIVAAVMFATGALAVQTDNGLPSAAFIGIKDGDIVHNPVKVAFSVDGIAIAPAGTDAPHTGHFHLFIDTTLTPEQMLAPIPSDPQHLHYGKGQKQDVLTLPPGTHSLQIVLGDGQHRPLNPPVVSPVIHITVQ